MSPSEKKAFWIVLTLHGAFFGVLMVASVLEGIQRKRVPPKVLMLVAPPGPGRGAGGGGGTAPFPPKLPAKAAAAAGSVAPKPAALKAPKPPEKKKAPEKKQPKPVEKKKEPTPQKVTYDEFVKKQGKPKPRPQKKDAKNAKTKAPDPKAKKATGKDKATDKKPAKSTAAASDKPAEKLPPPELLAIGGSSTAAAAAAGQKAGNASALPIGPGQGPGAPGGGGEDTALARFVMNLRALIQQAWEKPERLAGQNLEAQAQFTVDAAGNIVGVTLLRNSGNATFDASVQKALRDCGNVGQPPEGQSCTFALTFRMIEDNTPGG